MFMEFAGLSLSDFLFPYAVVLGKEEEAFLDLSLELDLLDLVSV